MRPAWPGSSTLGCIELHPHPVRSGDLDHPDELRVDLDPGPGVSWADVRTRRPGGEGAPGGDGASRLAQDQRLARNARECADRTALDFQPRCAARRSRLSRAVERRAPALASSKWWKEERHGVFLDYNQNAKDRTTCSAYSVRPLPDARVSTPLHWHEVPDCEPADFTVLTVPARFAELGDPHAGIDDAPGSLEKLLELAAKDEAAGLGDAPWPPHFRKMEGEAPRVAPSRAKSSAKRSSAKKPRSEDAADRGGEFSQQGRRAGRSGKVEDETRSRRPSLSPWMMCWSTPCEAGRPPGPASA